VSACCASSTRSGSAGLVAKGVRELRLAIALGDISGIDGALKTLRGTSIDRTALNGLEDAAKAGRAKGIEEALERCATGHSFAAGTEVLMASGAVKRIEDVKVAFSGAVASGPREADRI
jgi:hypothetical protein